MRLPFYRLDASPEDIKAGFVSGSRFREIIVTLCNDIHILGDTEEQLTNPNDLHVLAIELSSLLNELNCPYKCLMTGNPSTRFENEKNALRLLDYLIVELMALQMHHSNRAVGTGNVIELVSNLRMTIENKILIPQLQQETATAAALKVLCGALTMGAPPSNVTALDLFSRLTSRVNEILDRVGRSRIGKPLLSADKQWSDKQWMDLEKRHAELDKEYDLRREMLLTRLECTVQAFNWSERLKHKQSEILEKYRAKLSALERLVKGGANTDIVALLAARELLLAIEKASSAAVLKNTKSKIQRHIMGSVPDRGGRAWEHAPPPPEMPSWQKQRATGRGGQNFQHNRQNNAQHHQRTQNLQHHHQNDHQPYDNSRGTGRRVQSGWSQRGGGGNSSSSFEGQEGFSGNQRGRGRGGRYNNNNNYRGGRY